MVNPFPNEADVYVQIKKQKITMPLEIWNKLLYRCLGDFVIPIYLICRYYLNQNKPIPAFEAESIISCTANIKGIANEITRVAAGSSRFPELKNNTLLHPLVKDLFTYYIGNAVSLINLIVECSLKDPVSPNQISLESTKEIFNNIHQVRDFLYRILRETAYPLPN